MQRPEGSSTINMKGLRFGRLQVIKWEGTDAQRGAMWRCRCDCGNEIIVRRRNLVVKGNTLSCGCHRIDIQRIRRTKHGNTKSGEPKSKEYACWGNILQRCYNPRHRAFKSYGAKGVQVCEAWRHDFAAFLASVGSAPFAKAYIDRIDPFGNYEPGNVRWVDETASNRNKRSSFAD